MQTLTKKIIVAICAIIISAIAFFNVFVLCYLMALIMTYNLIGLIKAAKDNITQKTCKKEIRYMIGLTLFFAGYYYIEIAYPLAGFVLLGNLLLLIRLIGRWRKGYKIIEAVS